MNAIATMVLEDEGWAFCPSNVPPRLIRFDLPWSDFGLVAALTPEVNLLRINREIYDGLSALQQHVVERTRKEFTYIKDLQVW